MITKKEANKLRRQIKRHVEAQIDLSQNGARMPNFWKEYEDRAAEEKRKLFDLIKSLED